ncbi:tRNA adenosine(34) deaminase TadA [Candidatus Photodesmus anomalopis]|nr:tRNA adenosine(34) deaminase TadA [Candidatus Photodesmus katoptron]
MSNFIFTQQDKYFMYRAIKLASFAEKKGEVPVGALLIKNQRVIAEGWNQSINKNDPTAHAEIETLRKAGKLLKNHRLINTTLYVTLEPCPMCVGALLQGRVRRVVFGTPALKTGAAGTVLNLFKDHSAYHYTDVEYGLLKEECHIQLKNFFKQRRKKIKKAIAL